MALIFLFSSTFFILVNYCFGVYVVYHFYCRGFLYRDLGMVQFYKAISYSAKMQYLNHCPWEISFQMQLFGSNHSNVTGAAGDVVFQMCF